MEVSRAAGHNGYIRREVRSQQLSCASIGFAVLLKPSVEATSCGDAAGQAEACDGEMDSSRTTR